MIELEQGGLQLGRQLGRQLQQFVPRSALQQHDYFLFIVILRYFVHAPSERREERRAEKKGVKAAAAAKP